METYGARIVQLGKIASPLKTTVAMQLFSLWFAGLKETMSDLVVKVS